LYVLTGAIATGCAGLGKNTAPSGDKLQVKLADMRAESRRDKRKIRDLQNQIVKLKVDLEMSDEGWSDLSASESLPVEVVAPKEPRTAATELAVDPPAHESMRIAGTDQEGYEIVYAGDALNKPSVRPRLDKYDLGGSSSYNADEPTPTRAARHAPPRNLAPVPTSTVIIEPSSGALPTVDSQIRQARTPPSRSRQGRKFDDPREEYKRYYTALASGNHAYAIAGFRNFVERFPNHDHADNAQYWLGEAFYDQKRYSSAIEEFRKVVERYPGQNKVPDALLKLGYCYGALGKDDKAQSALNKVVKMYPKTNPAKLAAIKLEKRQD
jgi:tol-pal system protein YbgF